jgi:hypothetical protein
MKLDQRLDERVQAACRASFCKSFRFRRAAVIVPAKAAVIREDAAFDSAVLKP